MSSLTMPEGAGDTERRDPFSGLGLERDNGGDKFAGLGLEHADTNRQDPFAGLGLERETDAQDEAAAQRNTMLLNFRTGKLDPEQARQAYADMQRTNLPQSAVLSHGKEIRDMLEERDLDAFGVEAPLTAGWMAQDVIRTNIARDDTYTLEGVEGLLQNKGTWDLTKEAYAQSKDMMGDVELFERHMSGDRSPELLAAMKTVNDRRAAQTRGAQKPDGLWQEFSVNTAEQLPIQEVILSERGKGYLIGASSGAFFGSAVPVIGTIVGAAGGTFAGGAAYSATAAYRLESAFAYGDYLQAGIPEDAAGIAARVYGAGASVIEFADSLIDTSILGLSLNAAGKQSAKMTLKGALGGLIKNVAIGKAAEAVEEVAQQGLQIAVGEVAKLLTDTESGMTLDAAGAEILTAGWKTLWSAWGAESGTIRFGLDVRDARNGGGAAYVRDMALAAGQQREQEILSSLDDLSANSKLAQRDPGLYEEAVRAMNQDGQVQNVYIPAGGLSAVMGGSEAMANDPAASQRLSGVLDMLDVSGEDFSLALAGGNDLVIPIEKYAAAVAQDKEFAALIAQDRRLTSDGFTVRELQQWARDNESSLREAVKAAALSERQPTQLEAETQEISYAVQAQLETTGQPRDVAAANAAQMAAVFGTLSQRSGTSPMQLWGMYAPDVAQEGGLMVEAGEVLSAGGVQPSATQTVSIAYQQEGAPEIVGRITPEIAASFPLQKQGDILLDDARLVHIEEEHGQQIRDAGFTDARTFVNHVLQNIEGVYKGASNRTLHLVARGSGQWKNVVVRLEFDPQANFYRVKTALPVRQSFFKNKELLWDSAPYYQAGEGSQGLNAAHASGQTSSVSDIHISPDSVGVNAPPRGRIAFTTLSGRPLITLFQQADASTFLHESGHLYLEMLRSLGTAQNAAPELAAMWKQARDVLGRDTNGVITDATGNISTQAHELWASSLENYFMKGEAPSMELRNVFQKFGAWLKAIYNAFRSLGTSPTQDLDSVFARLLATDAQIAEVEQWHEAQKPWAEMMKAQTAKDAEAIAERNAEREAEAGNRAAQERHDADKSLEQFKEEAAAEARAKRLNTLTKAYTGALGGRKRFTAEAEAVANAMPVYAAMDEATKGVGLDMGTVAALMGEERAKALGKKRVALLRLEGGDDPLILAAKHGFDSTEAMLDAMLESEGKGKLIKRMSAHAEQQARDTIAQGVAEQETMPGDVEYHSEAQLAVLLAEKRLLDERTRLAGYRQQAKDSALEASALKEAARQTIAALPVAQATQAHRYSLAERRAAKSAWAETKAGNWEKAAAHKRQEAVSHALYLAATDARTKVDAARKIARKLMSDKRLTADAKDVISDIAYRFGLMLYGVGTIAESYAAWQRDAKRDMKEYPTLAEWVKEASDNGYPVAIEDFVMQGGVQDYRQITMIEFEEVASAIAQVGKIDRREQTVEVNGKKMELAELVNKMQAVTRKAFGDPKQMKSREKARLDWLKDKLKASNATLLKVQFLCDILDGGEVDKGRLGVWYSAIVSPLSKAEGVYAGMMKELRDKLASKEFFGGYSSSELKERVRIKSTGEYLDLEQRVSVLLNLGNNVNKNRILVGDRWDDSVIDEIKSTLAKRDFDFAQSVWDLFEQYKPAAFALDREILGKSPVAVEAVPLDTPFGQYRGGYYPIVYDKSNGAKALERAQADETKALFGGGFSGSAQTKRNHLKERAKSGTGEKVQLDFGVIPQKLVEVVHDIAYRKAGIEVYKVIRNKDVRKLVQDYLGAEIERLFFPWLRNVVNPAREPIGGIDKALKSVRLATTLYNMGRKITVITQQVTGILNSAELLGYGSMARGLAHVYGNPFKFAAMVKETMALSPFMASRITSYDREALDAHNALVKHGGVKKVITTSRDWAFRPIGIMQYAVDLPTWWGAYEKALAENNGDDAKAIAYADAAVEMSQGSGERKALAKIQNDTELSKAVTMFYSYFSVLHNIAARRLYLRKTEGGPMRLANAAFLLWVVAPLAAEILAFRGPDEEKDGW